MKGMNPVKSSPALLIPVFLVLSSVLIADSPPPNTIPLFAERPEFNEISLDTFLMLSWQYFDVLQVGGYSASQVYDKLIDSANTVLVFWLVRNDLPESLEGSSGGDGLHLTKSSSQMGHLA